MILELPAIDQLGGGDVGGGVRGVPVDHQGSGKLICVQIAVWVSVGGCIRSNMAWCGSVWVWVNVGQGGSV